jgi:1-acyl-sn-glycerol-3-phosphate acyltransferase
MIYAFMRWLMRAITRTYLVGLFRVEGADNVPRSGQLIVCSNHSSTVDPPMVPAFLPRSDSWSMAKAEWFRDWRRVIFAGYHAFPVVRHSADRKAIRRALELLSSGQALIMYPEGTRVREGGLRRAEPGAGFLAVRSASPVQPVALVGTRDCFPTGGRWPRRVPVRVRCGRPFRIARHHPDGRRLTNQDAADAIMVRVAELMPEDARGDYRDLEGWRRRLAGAWEDL